MSVKVLKNHASSASISLLIWRNCSNRASHANPVFRSYRLLESRKRAVWKTYPYAVERDPASASFKSYLTIDVGSQGIPPDSMLSGCEFEFHRGIKPLLQTLTGVRRMVPNS